VNPSILNGKKVIGTLGNILGEVEGIDVDINTWQISTLYVNLNDEAVAGFGIRKPFMSKVIVCLPTQVIKSVGDVITLNKPLSSLDEIARNCLVNPTKLKGKKIVGASGFTVGEIEGLDLDPVIWQVTSLQVSLTKDAASILGFSQPFLSRLIVAVPTHLVNLVGNMVVLNKTIIDLKSLKEQLLVS